jgi:hypothetical protein
MNKVGLLKFSLYMVAVALASVLFASAGLANRDPWIGTYTSKRVPMDGFEFGINKLTLSAGKAHDYNVRMEINHLIEETNGKPKVLEGYGDMYSPRDKSLGRLFLYFPKAKHSPFVELYAGGIIHPATASSAITGLSYTYYEKSQFPSYESGALVRMTNPTKAKKVK